MAERRVRSTKSFAIVKRAGLRLQGVEAGVSWDGSPVLRLDGCFLAGLAFHESAEPDTLVVRASLEDRALLIEDAPDTYYVTDYFQDKPVVLVRLARLRRDAVSDLLAMSWRQTLPKTRRGRRAVPVGKERT